MEVTKPYEFIGSASTCPLAKDVHSLVRCCGPFHAAQNRTHYACQLQCSHTGFEKPHETALELVYRAENRCKSIGARAGGLFQAFLGPIWAEKAPKLRFLDQKKA